MMKAIAYTHPNGGTSICRPAPWARLVAAFTLNGRHVLNPPVPFDLLVAQFNTESLAPEWAETENQFLTRIRLKDVPADATAVRIIDAADIPVDRTFRDALKIDLTHDMPRAREIQRDRMRAARAPKLAALDIAYQRADEAGDNAKKERITALKNALRDVTADPAIEAATTTEVLKAVWPAVLTDPLNINGAALTGLTVKGK